MNVTDILDAVVSLAGITVQLDRYVIGARRREGSVLKEPACTPTDERNAFLTGLQLENALVRCKIGSFDRRAFREDCASAVHALYCQCRNFSYSYSVIGRVPVLDADFVRNTGKNGRARRFQ